MTLKYIRSVVVSRIVAIRGPDINAGSTPNFLNIMGKIPPSDVAIMIATIIAMATVKPSITSPCRIIARSAVITPATTPIKIPIKNSFLITRQISLNLISPVARPLTTTVAACVPALPLVFINIGMKKLSVTILESKNEKCSRTLPEINPARARMINQITRF